MTNVIFTKTDKGLIKRIELHGHADSAPYGQDLICNAITVATQFLGIGICEVLEIEPEELIFKPEIPEVKFKLTDFQALKAAELTKTFFEYMSLLSQQHNNYLKMGVQNEKN